MTATYAYLEEWVQRRREHPGDDLLSRIVQMQVDGRAATHEEALGECALVLFGGLDNIRDCIAFPKTAKGTDLMCEAPSDVPERALRELGISLRKK